MVIFKKFILVIYYGKNDVLSLHNIHLMNFYFTEKSLVLWGLPIDFLLL